MSSPHQLTILLIDADYVYVVMSIIRPHLHSPRDTGMDFSRCFVQRSGCALEYCQVCKPPRYNSGISIA
jgi:hypothetical protein